MAQEGLVDTFQGDFASILHNSATYLEIFRHTLCANRTPIGPNDTTITRHAIAAGAIVVTNNMREFARVPEQCFRFLAFEHRF